MKNKYLVILVCLIALIGFGCSESDSEADSTPSSNADLSNIEISSPTPSSFTFVSSTTNYDVSVTSGSTSIDVTPTAADSGATIRVKESEGTTTSFETLASGATKTFDLVMGGYRTTRVADDNGNHIYIEVTAADQTTVKTYGITVTAND